MIYNETITDMIIKDLYLDNPAMNENHFQVVFEEHSKELDELQFTINRLVNKMKKDYYELNCISDESEKWICEEYLLENYNNSLQEVINYRIDKEFIHNSLEERKELYLQEYENEMLSTHDFMSKTYQLKSECQKEIDNWKLK
jgi:hypothetical protein